MKKLWIILFLLVSSFLMITTTRPVSAQISCVDFLAIADNTVMGNMFNVNGFQFKSPGGMVPFVNVFVDILGNPVHGVQFSNMGIIVRPPSPATSVDIEIGVFHNPNVTIRAINAAGGLEDVTTVPWDDTVHNVTLTSAVDPIVLLRFNGGGNEGVINEICSS
jgi:hypothetical protein